MSMSAALHAEASTSSGSEVLHVTFPAVSIRVAQAPVRSSEEPAFKKLIAVDFELSRHDEGLLAAHRGAPRPAWNHSPA